MDSQRGPLNPPPCQRLALAARAASCHKMREMEMPTAMLSASWNTRLKDQSNAEKRAASRGSSPSLVAHTILRIQQCTILIFNHKPSELEVETTTSHQVLMNHDIAMQSAWTLLPSAGI